MNYRRCRANSISTRNHDVRIRFTSPVTTPINQCRLPFRSPEYPDCKSPTSSSIDYRDAFRVTDKIDCPSCMFPVPLRSDFHFCNELKLRAVRSSDTYSHICRQKRVSHLLFQASIGCPRKNSILSLRTRIQHGCITLIKTQRAIFF